MNDLIEYTSFKKVEKDYTKLLLKSNCDSRILEQYFNIKKGEFFHYNYSILNNHQIIVSMYGLLNVISQTNYSVFEEIQNLASDNGWISFNNSRRLSMTLTKYFAFYKLNNVNSIVELKIDYLFKYKQYESNFFPHYLKYFKESDNYFSIKDTINTFHWFAILTFHSDFCIDYNLDQIKCKKGNKILVINSSLSSLSFMHFSGSLSLGHISNILLSDTLLLDIRVIPSCHGSPVFGYVNNKLKQIAIILPLLNLEKSFTPIVIALKFDDLCNYIRSCHILNISETEQYLRAESNFNLSIERSIFLLKVGNL